MTSGGPLTGLRVVELSRFDAPVRDIDDTLCEAEAIVEERSRQRGC